MAVWGCGGQELGRVLVLKVEDSSRYLSGKDRKLGRRVATFGNDALCYQTETVHVTTKTARTKHVELWPLVHDGRPKDEKRCQKQLPGHKQKR